MIVEVVRVADSEIDTETLFEQRRVQRRDVGDEHLWRLPFMNQEAQPENRRVAANGNKVAR